MAWTAFDQFLWNTLLTVQFPAIFIAIGFGLPAALLYCTEIWLIVRHAQFRNTSFYILFAARALLNLLAMANAYVHYRLPTIWGPALLPLYKLTPNWLQIAVGSSFLPNYTLQADNLATAFLLLNRLTAITSPFTYEKLWRKLLPVSLVVIFGLPLYFGRYFFGMSAGFYVNTESNGVGSNPLVGEFIVCECGDQNTHYVNDDYFLMFVCCVVFLGVCLALNIAIIVAYRRREKHSKLAKATSNRVGAQAQNDLDTQQQRQQQRTENKLFVYAFFTFLGHMLFTLSTVGSFVLSKGGHGVGLGTLQAVSPLVFDTGSVLIPSVLLFWASDDVRAKWLKQFVPGPVAAFGARLRALLGLSNTASSSTAISVTAVKVLKVTPTPVMQ